MKEVPKMEVSRGLGITLIMLAVVGMTMFALGAIMSESRHEKCGGHEQNVQPQPPPTPDAPKTTTHECVAEPWNPLRAIADRVERGMTKERLERNIAELDDGRLPPVTVRKERFPLTNGTSYGMEYWSWTLEMKKAERETWEVTLMLDLCEDKVVGIHYASDYNVAVMSIHK